MDLMEQIRLEMKKHFEEKIWYPLGNDCDAMLRDAFLAGTQALLHLLGRSATSEGQFPRILMLRSQEPPRLLVSSVENLDCLALGLHGFMTTAECQALRAADLLEKEQAAAMLLKQTETIEQLRHELKMGHHCGEMLHAEREARKGDSAEIARLEDAVAGLTIQRDGAETRGLMVLEAKNKMLAAERARNARLTAALEKIVEIGKTEWEGDPAWNHQAVVAMEALGEAGKPEEPHPRGYCEKCGLPLRGREDFPLLCTCMLGEAGKS